MVLWQYALQPHTSYNGGRRQYVWPATGSDSCSARMPGGCYAGTLKYLAPGALLAIPSTVHDNIQHKIKTVPGKKIFKALTDYGGYIVDDTGGTNTAAICMSAEVNDEMRKAFGFTMTYPHGVSPRQDDPGRDMYVDLLLIFQNLHVVINNGPDSIGGGGTPRQPTKCAGKIERLNQKKNKK